MELAEKIICFALCSHTHSTWIKAKMQTRPQARSRHC
jgi:hypothetical protein